MGDPNRRHVPVTEADIDRFLDRLEGEEAAGNETFLPEAESVESIARSHRLRTVA